MSLAFTIIGWVGTGLLIVSLLQTRILRLRVINSLASILQIAYAVAGRLWPVVGTSVAVLLINVYQLIRIHRERRRAASAEAVTEP